MYLNIYTFAHICRYMELPIYENCDERLKIAQDKKINYRYITIVLYYRKIVKRNECRYYNGAIQMPQRLDLRLCLLRHNILKKYQ